MADNSLTEEQKMLEKPVKGYQLRELTSAVNEFKDDASKKLDAILVELKGTVTEAHLSVRMGELELKVTEYIDDEIQKVHLEYGPTKKAAWYVLGAITVALVGQLVWLVFNRQGG